MMNVDKSAPFAIKEAIRDACINLPDEIVIIASWADEQAHDIRIQNFDRDGESFIPLFSSEAEFKCQTQGSGFEASGVVIKTDIFLSMMRGGEWLIVDPGGYSPTEIRLPAIT